MEVYKAIKYIRLSYTNDKTVESDSVPKKQGRRIYAHYFLGISKSEIARLEHCHKSTI